MQRFWWTWNWVEYILEMRWKTNLPAIILSKLPMLRSMYVDCDDTQAPYVTQIDG